MVVRRVRRAVRTIVKALERVQQPRALRGQRRVAPIARPRDRATAMWISSAIR